MTGKVNEKPYLRQAKQLALHARLAFGLLLRLLALGPEGKLWVPNRKIKKKFAALKITLKILR